MRTQTLMILTALFVLGGCQWDPPHDGLVDPKNQLFEPTGVLELLILDSTNHQPVYNAEVRVDSLRLFNQSDELGKVLFSAFPVGSYKLTASRESFADRDYKLDSMWIDIGEGMTVTDTFFLAVLPPPPENLLIRVINLRRQPIENVYVSISDLGRFKTTDADGWVEFDNVPGGETYQIVAHREDGNVPQYALDTVAVVTLIENPTYAEITLDGLPYFTDARVNSQTIKTRYDLPLEKRLRLVARADDPDGDTDIDLVECHFLDSVYVLTFNRDSSWYSSIVESSELPNGDIENAKYETFYFQVSDDRGKTATISASLVRIISAFLSVDGPVDPENDSPEFRWEYAPGEDFEGEFPQNFFNYLLRIYRDDGQDIDFVAYDTLFSAPGTDIRHRIGTVLDAGSYFYYVWVVDHFGNYQRFHRLSFRK